MSVHAAEHGHRELVRRIRAAGERWKRRTAALGALRAAATAAAAFTSLVILEALVVLPPLARVIWLSVAAAVAAAGLFGWVVSPLLRRLDPVELAARIEERLPDLGERLESSAELWDKRGAGRHGYSVELIDALILRTASEAAGADFRIPSSAREARRAAIVSAAVLFVSAAATASLGPRLAPALSRLADPMSAPDAPELHIAVEPGDTTLVSGDDLAVSAVMTGPFEGVPSLVYVPADERPSRLPMEPDTARGSEAQGARFRALVRDVRSDLRYRVEAGDVSSPEFAVRVVERPFVTNIRLEYSFPSYSGLLPRTVDENNGDITALVGTRVKVTITSSKPLARAELAAEDGARVPMSAVGPRSFSGTLTVRGDGAYSIGVVDTDGLANADPPTYSIVSIRDERPLVRIVEPGEDVEAPRGMVLPVVVSAIDDYGISVLSLRYALEGSSDESVLALDEPGASGPREISRGVEWDLSETGLLPGRSLVYYAEVTDNDGVTGPKTARSESYVVRFPSMSELYSDVVSEHADIAEELDDVLEEQRALRDEFENLREEIRSEPRIDWQREEEVESALERQEAAAEEVARVADRLSDLSESMTESDRVTLETLDKIEEITRLLDEVATDEMRELLERIREAMERVSPEDVSEAMENLSITQDDYLRRLEQTLNLLRRAKAEQALADVANRAGELAERERRLGEEAAGSPSEEETRALAEEQERLAEELAKLKEDLAAAAREMAEVDPSAAREMAEAAAQMDASGVSEKMEQARQRLSDSKPSEASAMCKSAASDLLTLFTQLSSCQGGMSCSLQKRDRETTLRAVDELLGVSAEQEKIVAAVENRRRIPRSELVELVAKEADLVDAMSAIANRMFEVSKDSFVIDPGIYRAFGKVQMMMTRAAAFIANGGSSAGYKDAKAALGSINRLIVSLLTSSQSSSGASGGAMEQLMQQLRQMSDQQAQLNSMTEELRRQMEELGMSAGVERQLAEVKARQERILDEARRLAKEFGDRREILGRLDDTVEEMERTLAEMERSGASQETVDRQKRILSRLLDAQRSMRRRDYTRRRASESGRDYSRTVPGALPESVTRVAQELREDLLRAMQQGYPSEYRELIRAYFERLTGDADGAGAAGSGTGVGPGGGRPGGGSSEVAP